MNNPFCYEPHPLCIMACKELQEEIAQRDDWREEIDRGKMFGVLISGHAEISMTDNTGTRSVVSQLNAGDVFGVLSLLTGDRVTADVIDWHSTAWGCTQASAKA